MTDSNATPELLLVPTYLLHTPFFGPKEKTTLCMKKAEMPALERYLKLRYRLLGRVRKTTKAKLAGKNISLSEVRPVLNNT